MQKIQGFSTSFFLMACEFSVGELRHKIIQGRRVIVADFYDQNENVTVTVNIAGTILISSKSEKGM